MVLGVSGGRHAAAFYSLVLLGRNTRSIFLEVVHPPDLGHPADFRFSLLFGSSRSSSDDLSGVTHASNIDRDTIFCGRLLSAGKELESQSSLPCGASDRRLSDQYRQKFLGVIVVDESSESEE